MDLKSKIILVVLLSLLLVLIQSSSTLASENNKSRMRIDEVKPYQKPQSFV